MNDILKEKLNLLDICFIRKQGKSITIQNQNKVLLNVYNIDHNDFIYEILSIAITGIVIFGMAFFLSFFFQNFTIGKIVLGSLFCLSSFATTLFILFYELMRKK